MHDGDVDVLICVVKSCKFTGDVWGKSFILAVSILNSSSDFFPDGERPKALHSVRSSSQSNADLCS